MSFRRNRNFQIRAELDAGTENCRIPKFSLQPFVENSIIHGFSESGMENGNEEYQILVRAYFEESRLCVQVADNGKGFRTETIAEKPEENGIRFSHIGMANVEERIHLYFGKEYGIKVDSTPGKGTVVYLTLPGKDSDNL